MAMKPTKKLLATPVLLARRRIGRSRDDDASTDGGAGAEAEGGPSTPPAPHSNEASSPLPKTPDRPPPRSAVLDDYSYSPDGPDDRLLPAAGGGGDVREGTNSLPSVAGGVEARREALSIRGRTWREDRARSLDRRRRGEFAAGSSPSSSPSSSPTSSSGSTSSVSSRYRSTEREDRYAAKVDSSPSSRVSSRYLSSHREDRYAAGFDSAVVESKHGRSPRGVDQFESDGTYERARCDSHREAAILTRLRKGGGAGRSPAKSPGKSPEKSPGKSPAKPPGKSVGASPSELRTSRSRGSSFFDDARTTDPSSSALVAESASPASRSSALRGAGGGADDAPIDDASTMEPRSLVVADDDDEDGTTLAGETLLTDDITESEGKSYPTSLDDGTSSSYLWSLLDDDDRDGRRDGRRRRRGTGEATRTPRTTAKERVRSETPTTTNVSRRRGRDGVVALADSSHSETDRDDGATEVGTAATFEEADDDAASALTMPEFACPRVPSTMEDAAGWWKDDAASAWGRVVRACFVSPEDADAAAGRLDDATADLREMWARGGTGGRCLG